MYKHRYYLPQHLEQLNMFSNEPRTLFPLV
nr:MAG TPA: hypothetical protein [Caudoviricetes sp.]